MRAVIEGLAATDFDEAVLWVLDDNPRARRFYERCGWLATGGAKTIHLDGHDIIEVGYHRQLSLTTWRPTPTC